MTVSNENLSVAPVVVARAARWPALGLLALATAARSSERKSTPQTHAQQLQDELHQLWRSTLGDETFRQALAISNPPLYMRLRRKSCPRTLNKAARQLAGTLFHQWSRACWRTEPNALWAGVALCPLDETSIESHDPQPPRDDAAAGANKVAVAPHLAPFAWMLDALARTPSYRYLGRFRIYPGAHRESPGVWCFRVRDGNGNMRTRRLTLRDVDAGRIDPCITRLIECASLRHDEIVNTVCAALGNDEVARDLVDRLIAAQLLIGGLSLTPAFETAWHALAQATDTLLPADARAWYDCVTSVRALCTHLESSHRDMNADQIAQALIDAGRMIEALGAQLGVPGVRLPRAALHWDCGLPAPLRIDAATARRIRSAVDLHEANHRNHDLAPVIDQLYANAHDKGCVAELTDAFGAQSHGDSLAAVLDTIGCDPALTDRIKGDWKSITLKRTASHTNNSRDASAAPFGALVMRCGATGLLIQSFSNEPWLAYARYGELLGSTAPHAHSLHDWCDRAMQCFAKDSEVRLGQLFSLCAPMANLLAQPRFANTAPFAPYGTLPDALPDASLHHRHDGKRRWLQATSSARPLLVFSASTLDVGRDDPLLERALLTGWRYRPPPLAAALCDDLAISSKPDLTSDIAVQRARWQLRGEAARALAHTDPSERWQRWQSLARDQGFPALVTVSRDGQVPLLMPRDSALAVEVVFRAPGTSDPAFDIEEPADEFLLTDQKGNRYATELIVVFARRHHAWQLRNTSLDTVSPDTSHAEGLA